MRKIYLTALVGAVAFATPAAAQTYNLSIAGYSPGGLVSTVGIGLDAAVAAAYPGSTLTYQTSSGGLANAMLIEQNKVPLAFIADHELNVAVKGMEPIKTPLKNLTMLVRPYSPGSRFQMTHVVFSKAWADSNGVKTFADIAAKKPAMRVAVNRPGTLDGDVALAVLKANGISQDDIKSWGGQVVRAASSEMRSLMVDRRIDGIVLGVSYNHSSIREIAQSLPVIMLPVTDAVAKQAASDLGVSPCMVKASEYDFLAADTASVCVGMQLVARSDMDAQIAYNVTKAIVENVEKYKAAHPLLQKAVTEKTLAEGGLVPFHPGAAKYLREKGLLK
jgi:TRAP transporter TAXI family solute receptor